MRGIGTVDHELLGDAVGLDNDIFDVEIALGDLQRFPSLTLVPREFNEVSGAVLASDHKKGTVVANLVDVGAHADGPPGEATVPRQEEGLLRVVVGQLGAQVASAEDDTNGFLAGVNRSELTHMRVNLEVERAAIFDVTGGLFAHHGDFGGLDELPLAALVVCDVSLDVLLDLVGRYGLLDLKDLFLSVVLLFVADGAHARVSAVSGFFSNHVRLVPLDLRVGPVVNSALVASVLPATASLHLSHDAWAVLVGEEGSIEGCDTLKIDSVALDHVFQTERESSASNI
mmetsp:Transcript_25739/g.32040  ORF Transcript_25739/g.32040 Transcript_25739/m.32040 type:complete len:286 (-) Transcript_25739:1075-1932(-)